MIKHSFLILVVGMLLGISVPGQARDSLLPVIPEAQERFSETQGCVEPVEEMRKNHMEYIMHQRDETMQDGVRSNPYSLRECLDCHVVIGADAMPVTARDPQHFCRSCHDYAAVNIDCFGCHASRPEAAGTGSPGGAR